MNIIIIGAGRMGIRHAQGLVNIETISRITMVDIKQDALDYAQSQFEQNKEHSKLEFLLLKDFISTSQNFDIGIIASTANNRIKLYTILTKVGCKNILAEKPLGQSYREVIEFNMVVEKLGIPCYVNLNMHVNSTYIQLREDLNTFPQFEGYKTITINTGALGIGANGIHYLDMLFFLFGADEARILAAEIDDVLIPSGRGDVFGDFGGWCVINFYKNEKVLGKAILSMSAISTVYGSWEIVGSHGRIYLNEVEQKRVDTLRKIDSKMPYNRYYADYLTPKEIKFNSPLLGDLTAEWLIGLLNGKKLLPTVEESIQVHSLMFDWLSYSKKYKESFPIT